MDPTIDNEPRTPDKGEGMTKRWPVVTCLIAATARAGPNLMSNPGFEEGPVQAIAIGWVPRGEPAPPGYNGVDTSVKRSGARSQYLRHCDIPGPLGWDQCGSVAQVTPYNSVTPGRTYNVSVWLRKQGGANPAGWFVFGIEWFHDDAVTGEVKMPSTLPLNYDWTLVTYQVTAPPTGYNGPPNRLGVWLTRHTDADVWYDDVSVTDVTPGTPIIVRSPVSFVHTIVCGHNLPSDPFTLSNGDGGTLNYTLTADQEWLSPSVPAGSSTGETDFLTIDYDVAGLPVGHSVGNITITDPAAANSPQSIQVSLTISAPGDFDLDGDVDMSDFGHFQFCLTGDGVPQILVGCQDTQLDDDSDVDQNDFGIFTDCLSGANVPPPPQCCVPSGP